MSESSGKDQLLDAQQVVYLPKWAKFSIIFLLALLAITSCTGAFFFLTVPTSRDLVVPAMAIGQTAIGGFAVVMFVLFSEKQLSTERLYEKTDLFLTQHIVESFKRIEIPQICKDKTVSVVTLTRGANVHGHRKDIYGSNYEISLENFKMRVWVGINVKRLGIIYFAKVDGPDSLVRLEEDFRFTFGGAEKVGYHTNFEYACIEDEHIVSIWSTVFAENAILGNPAEQLFWVQDLAMMTQSVARTAVRHNWIFDTKTDPGPL